MKLDFIGFDCTFGSVPNVPYKGHMGLDTNVKQYEEFKKKGLLKEDTKVLLTHFSHWYIPLHGEMAKLGAEYGFDVAYDGICYEV